METLHFVYFCVFVAFVFDFINGFHDAANSIATLVGTRLFKPAGAVCWAAFFNFIAFLFFQLQVAKTIGTGLVAPHAVDAHVILAALTGAIAFNLITWYVGLPSSSSHALIGGLAGAAAAAAGWDVLHWANFGKIALSVLLCPALGLGLALCCFTAVRSGLQRWGYSDFRGKAKYLQLVSSALLCVVHGANDAQKTMGIITVLLYTHGLIGPVFAVPTWVVLSCNLVIALGTLCGGWRIVNTLGRQITVLTPAKAVSAEASAALILFGATSLGIPVSTTQTITGSVVGAGAAQGRDANNWHVVRRIAWAWAFTIPTSAAIAACVMTIIGGT